MSSTTPEPPLPPVPPDWFPNPGEIQQPDDGPQIGPAPPDTPPLNTEIPDGPEPHDPAESEPPDVESGPDA